MCVFERERECVCVGEREGESERGESGQTVLVSCRWYSRNSEPVKENEKRQMVAPTDGPKESQRLVLSQIRVEFDLNPLRSIHRLVIVNRIK